MREIISKKIRENARRKENRKQKDIVRQIERDNENTHIYTKNGGHKGKSAIKRKWKGDISIYLYIYIYIMNGESVFVGEKSGG